MIFGSTKQHLLGHGFVLANVGQEYDDLTRAIRNEFLDFSYTEFFVGIVLFVLAIAIVIWISKWQERRRFPQQINDPSKLFDELISLLELDSSERDFLWSIARSARFSQPAVLLLSESIWEKHVGPIETSPESESQRIMAKKLRHRLFGPLIQAPSPLGRGDSGGS